MTRRGLGGFLRRRRFYRQLPRIVARRLTTRDRRPAVFVSLMGGVGDLVNLFPTLERLSERFAVDLGTGPPPYAALAAADPHVRTLYWPFVYKPIRRAHRHVIRGVLAPFYERVVLLDEPDSAWQTRRRHLSDVYAERCGCPPPARGAVYVPAEHHRRAAAYLTAAGLDDFIYVAQVIRASRRLRSWPLAHYHALYRMLRARGAGTILVDTVGSDETAMPDFCRRLEGLDVLTAAAVIGHARLYIGTDGGLTHVAAALNIPTVAIHVGYPPETCRALGDNVLVVRQEHPLEDPARTTPERVLGTIEAAHLLPG